MVLSTEFCHLEENHDTRCHVCFGGCDQTTKLSTTPKNLSQGSKQSKYQRNLWGMGKRQFLSIFKGQLASPACTLVKFNMPSELPIHKVNNKKFNRFLLWSFMCSMSSYCVQLTKPLISESHVFDQKQV